MKDAFAREATVQGDDPAILSILEEVCRITDMGFAAVARVTDTRWIACQVLDKIEFGLRPGDELEIKTTICDEIRRSGQAIVIDHVADNPDWQTHTPRCSMASKAMPPSRSSLMTAAFSAPSA